MPINKPKVGDYIEYWYHKKFQKGEIIEKAKDKITIKLWNSILNPKIITIDYPADWRHKVNLNSIISRPKNKKFPSWIKICQLCIIHESTNTNYYQSSRIIAKIAKYQDGKNITLFYIKYPENSYDTKKLKTITVNLSNQKNFSSKSPYINFTDHDKHKILYPYCSQIEIDDDYDKINDINNNKLIQKLWKNGSNLKSTEQQIHKMINNEKHNDDDCSSYITTSKLQYGVILECDVFPFDINRLIISFLAQRMIYICPPTPCNKIEQNAQMWQFNEIIYKMTRYNDSITKYELSTIGVEFKMNEDLWIAGFELNNIELLGRYKHKIILKYAPDEYIETVQLQLNQQLRNAQFVFAEKKLIKLNYGQTYTVEIKVNANVPCYQCHEPPSNINGFINNGRNTLYGWKCFKYIT